MAEILMAAANVALVVAFVIYNKSIFQNKSQPNVVSWLLWALLTAVNAITYIIMSVDWVKGALAIVAFFVCAATFFISLLNGKFSKLNLLDVVALVIGLLSITVWLAFDSATYAHLVLQIGMIVPFIPTYSDLWNKKTAENPVPWFMWSAAYLIGALVVVLRWQGQYEDLVFPLRTFVLHFGVGLIALRNAIFYKNSS